jgi:hypothetical protein
MLHSIILALVTLTLCTYSGVISVASDQLVTLAQLAKRIPRRRNNKAVHPSTVHRWRRPGIRGVRLECIRIGGAWHTTFRAFQEFCEHLSAEDPNCRPQETPVKNETAEKEQTRHHEIVERELEQFGV